MLLRVGTRGSRLALTQAEHAADALRRPGVEIALVPITTAGDRERSLDAVVLAACGLERLGLAGEIGYRFEPEELLPEAGQGALALQVRAGEEELVSAADDRETRRRVEAERRCVAVVGAGCLAPV